MVEAPRHIGARDRYIGWSAEARRRNIRFIAYNTRFLILPWVKVEHLASHILGRMAARISDDWQQMYGHPIYFLETFVDPERFRGTCYRAANWVWLGKTTGRGKQSNSYVPNRSIKEVLGYPLSRRFRELLEGQDESSQTTCGCQPGGTGPGAGPGARKPLSEADYEKLKSALHVLAAMLVRPRSEQRKPAPCWRKLLKRQARSSRIRTQPYAGAWAQRGGGVWRRAEDCDLASAAEAWGSLPGM